jgi:hypothetical protein
VSRGSVLKMERVDDNIGDNQLVPVKMLSFCAARRHKTLSCLKLFKIARKHCLTFPKACLQWPDKKCLR